MIYKRKPKDFNPRFEVVSCFCEHDGQILMLHRLDGKSEGNKWGVPAGKIDPGETAQQSILREIFEETGNMIQADDLELIEEVYVRYPDYDFKFLMFKTKLKNKISVLLRPNEHKDFKWITPQEALKLELVQDMAPCIEIYLLKHTLN